MGRHYDVSAKHFLPLIAELAQTPIPRSAGPFWQQASFVFARDPEGFRLSLLNHYIVILFVSE